MLLAHHQAKWPLASLRIHPTQQVPKGPRETASPAWAAFVLAKKKKHEGPKVTGQLETMVLRGRVLEPRPTATP